MAATPQSISVIMPTLNEASEIRETIARARQSPAVTEIVVVDGGSRDETRALAEGLGCQVLTAGGGRGGQLKAGAEVARGDVLLFLHADTWLPPEAGQRVLESLADDAVVGGGFWKVFRDGTWLMRGSRARCALRFWLGRRFMGDQAIYCRREVLQRVGGFPAMPLMEEFELCRRLQTAGRMVLARATVSTSARRFRKRGVLATYWLMARVTWGYWLGASPEALRRLYERE